MNNNIDNLKKLLDQLNSIGFFQRVFGWRKFRELLMEANADLQKLAINSDGLIVENPLNVTTSIRSKLTT